MLKKEQNTSYGGDLLKTRKGRAKARPLQSKKSMHLVLRSSKAKGKMSFKKYHKRIQEIMDRFALKYGVRIISQANVGNHLHFHIQLSRIYTYRPFIRAITSAIAMAVTGASRWCPMKEIINEGRFWDRRPFTRIVTSFKDYLNIENYVAINQLEGAGFARWEARYILDKQRGNTS